MSTSELENLNLSSTINKYDLRDYANNVEDYKKAIELLIKNLNTDDIKLKVQILGQLGSFNRRINLLEEATKYFTEAIELVNEHQLDRRFLIANSLRLAHTYHWQEDYKSAHTLFSEIILICQSKEEFYIYLDFAYQHFGKCLFDEKNYSTALNYFQMAMEIREEKGDQSLIDSTLIAINATEEKLSLNS